MLHGVTREGEGEGEGEGEEPCRRTRTLPCEATSWRKKKEIKINLSSRKHGGGTSKKQKLTQSLCSWSNAETTENFFLKGVAIQLVSYPRCRFEYVDRLLPCSTPQEKKSVLQASLWPVRTSWADARKLGQSFRAELPCRASPVCSRT
jgi:hypothetical protein